MTQHRDWNLKNEQVGGLTHYEVRPSDWGVSCYFMVGPKCSVDISYRMAIRDIGTKPRDSEKDHRSDVYSALRAEIKDQIDAIECPPGWHVDHKPPKYFSSIVDEWLGGRGVADIEVMDTQGGAYFLADPFLAVDWREFHRAVAELRAAPPEQLKDRPKQAGGI